MKHKKKAVIKSKPADPRQTKLRKVTDADIGFNKKWYEAVKRAGGFKYDDDEASPNTRDIEKAESMPEWIGGGVFDPRWNDVYLDLDPEHPVREPQPTAGELAERRAIEIKAGQEAADLLNRFYRLGKYASHK